MSKAYLAPRQIGIALGKSAAYSFQHTTPCLGDRAAKAIMQIYLSKIGKSDYIGEAVSQIEHAQQAAYFASLETQDEDVILASLLHDIGHLIPDQPQMSGNLGTQHHEELGAGVLHGLGFSDKTCHLIAHHVDAKRYLCYKMPNYYNSLSEASRGTLKQQGGVMSQREAEEFEKDPLSKTIILMRTWDEKAKVVGLQCKPFTAYFDNISRSVERKIARDSYEREGYCILKNVFTYEEKKKLVQWCTDIQNWAPKKGEHMVYYELVNGTETLSRTENFLPYHKELRQLLTEGEIPRIIGEILGDKAVLYKEKINYKLAGGGGFPAHQDAPAFETFGASRHLTLNIAIDASNPANGGLQVSPGMHKEGLYEQNPAHGGLSDKAEAGIAWRDVILDVGDVLLFSSWLPHRSGTNYTDKSRRALYITYNGAADGDHREAYYIDKRKNFPQKIEREEGKDYSEGAKRYNLATPIVG
jgi:predicted HD phosphohydrolase/ectoine hydroxylase-related dioxygenase (phytanoyl-CoA dioxygenase family)